MSEILNHKIYGNQKPVLLVLHGLFGMLDNWHLMAGRWSEQFTVITIDQRNHGKSFHHPEMTYEAMADDVVRLMDHLEIESAFVLGHSMGGKTAMTLAKFHPERVAGLIVVDMGIKAYSGGHEPYFKALLELKKQTIESRKEADEFLSSRIPELGIRQFLLKNLVRTKEGYSLKMNLEVIHQFYREMIGALEFPIPVMTPALFVRGGDSNYIQSSDMPEIEEAFSNVEFETIEDAGHWIHADKPLELHNSVLEFIQNHN
jgi:pimeloyl-ACP methyl ester carboxylesterase